MPVYLCGLFLWSVFQAACGNTGLRRNHILSIVGYSSAGCLKHIKGRLMLVNKRELSEILGITERSLTEWQKDGLPVASFADLRGQANEYDTKAVIGWLIQRELQRINREKPRDRLDRLKADAIELEIKERTGELAPAALFERAWADHITAARTEFLTLPETLASELSAIVGQPIDSELITAHVERALEKLANYGAEDAELSGDDAAEYGGHGAPGAA